MDDETEQRAVDTALAIGRVIVERDCSADEAVAALVAALAHVVSERGLNAREVFRMLARQIVDAAPLRIVASTAMPTGAVLMITPEGQHVTLTNVDLPNDPSELN